MGPRVSRQLGVDDIAKGTQPYPLGARSQLWYFWVVAADQTGAVDFAKERGLLCVGSSGAMFRVF